MHESHNKLTPQELRSRAIISEPYKATKLWNDTVRAFYNGMPVIKHWRGLRHYDNCFTAIEAVDWLNGHLKSDSNFGPSVSKQQTVKLLSKFLKSGLIVEARGNKIHPDDFRENRELFKFGNQSPLKAFRTPRRTPLASLNTNGTSKFNGASPSLNKISNKGKASKSPNHENSCQDNFTNECKDQKFPLYANVYNENDIDEAWKDIFSQRLDEVSEQLLVGGDGSCPLIPMSYMDVSCIRRNMKNVNDKEEKSKDSGHMMSDKLPEWLVSAMKCLANWPNSSESICNIPNYPGVEIDVFKVVKDYFSSSVIPLIPYELYDAIIRLYIGAEFLDIVHRSPSVASNESKLLQETSSSQNFDDSLSHCDSVENLILDISMNATQQTSTPFYIQDDYKEKISEHCKTPVIKTNDLKSVPRSLRLNTLQEYTDFKESYLYPSDCNIDSVCSEKVASIGNESLNRRTLKELKNKSKIRNNTGSSLPAVEPMIPTANFMPKLLKTEELDNFSLPPNSCFETAFTSNSPRTRIIPQKSVDSLHFGIVSKRPKSIAVPSFYSTSETKSCNDLLTLPRRSLISLSDADKTLSREALDPLTSFNRSYSEGNLMSCGGEESLRNYSGVELSVAENSREDSFDSKSSLASRVRDSLKKKKSKICKPHQKYSKVTKNNCTSFGIPASRSISTESLNSIQGSDSSVLSKITRMRTKSGGYRNPSFAGSLDLNEDTRTCYSRNSSGIASQCSHSDSPSGFSDSSSFQWKNQSDNQSIDSQFVSEPSSTLSRLRRYSRSKSATPNACLSHSTNSSCSNSLYLSAMSGFNQTATSTSMKVSQAIKRRCRSVDPQLTPTLPKRAPIVINDLSDLGVGSLHETSDLSSAKPLSTSASELSDGWTDRTPFGRVPPYLRGGLWRHYYSSPSKRLLGGRRHQVDRFGENKACLPGLLTRAGKDISIEALQLICLLLDPSRKKKLHLLLKMMAKVSANDKLQLHKDCTNRALMVKTFCRTVLLSEKEMNFDELLALRVVTFMMDNHEAIFAPSHHLAVLVHRKLNAPRRAKSRDLENRILTPKVAFCHQISPKTFEKQRLTGSQQFLSELLDQILENPKMSAKDRRKKLKEFKIHYPEIYDHKFPPGKENEFLPPLPKKRLRGLKKFASIKSLSRAKSFRI